jgi:hypothetical protein
MKAWRCAPAHEPSAATTYIEIKASQSIVFRMVVTTSTAAGTPHRSRTRQRRTTAAPMPRNADHAKFRRTPPLQHLTGKKTAEACNLGDDRPASHASATTASSSSPLNHRRRSTRPEPRHANKTSSLRCRQLYSEQIDTSRQAALTGWVRPRALADV